MHKLLYDPFLSLIVSESRTADENIDIIIIAIRDRGIDALAGNISMPDARRTSSVMVFDIMRNLTLNIGKSISFIQNRCGNQNIVYSHSPKQCLQLPWQRLVQSMLCLFVAESTNFTRSIIVLISAERHTISLPDFCLLYRNKQLDCSVFYDFPFNATVTGFDPLSKRQMLYYQNLLWCLAV